MLGCGAPGSREAPRGGPLPILTPLLLSLHVFQTTDLLLFLCRFERDLQQLKRPHVDLRDPRLLAVSTSLAGLPPSPSPALSPALQVSSGRTHCMVACGSSQPHSLFEAGLLLEPGSRPPRWGLGGAARQPWALQPLPRGPLSPAGPSFRLLRKYATISSSEQRQSYKNDFNAEYSEYRDLHARIEQITRRFTQLDAQLRQLSQGSEEYEVEWGVEPRALPAPRSVPASPCPAPDLGETLLVGATKPQASNPSQVRRPPCSASVSPCPSPARSCPWLLVCFGPVPAALPWESTGSWAQLGLRCSGDTGDRLRRGEMTCWGRSCVQSHRNSQAL